MAGTVRVRTRKVSSSSPKPMMRPVWIMMATEPTMRPEHAGGEYQAAEVMTVPVFATVRRTPTRMLVPILRGAVRRAACCSRADGDEDDECE